MDKLLEKNLERYESMFQENRRKREELDKLKKEIENIRTNNKYFEEARKHIRRELASKKNEALNNGNFIEYKKLEEQQKKQIKTNNLYLKINKSLEKLNRLSVKNEELQKKIDKRLEVMARREVMADNIFQSKIASFKNSLDMYKLNYQTKQLDKGREKIKAEEHKFNNSLESNKDYQKLTTNEELLKNKRELEKKFEENAYLNSEDNSKEIDQKKMQDYERKQEINPKTNLKRDIYTHKATNVRVIDNGNTLIAKGGTDKEKAQALYKVAREKGWKIQNIIATGTKDFKNEINNLAEAEKQKQQEKIRKMEELQKQQAENFKTKPKPKEKSFSLQR